MAMTKAFWIAMASILVLAMIAAATHEAWGQSRDNVWSRALERNQQYYRDRRIESRDFDRFVVQNEILNTLRGPQSGPYIHFGQPFADLPPGVPRCTLRPRFCEQWYYEQERMKFEAELNELRRLATQ